jgi:hypothetical protein
MGKRTQIADGRGTGQRYPTNQTTDESSHTAEALIGLFDGNGTLAVLPA